MLQSELVMRQAIDDVQVKLKLKNFSWAFKTASESRLENLLDELADAA